MPERHSTKELFYGYADWVIAEWCCVTLQTARHWKSGIRAPGPSALKLFMLHRDERILTSEWEGWGVRKGKLCDPEGHETTQGQLRAYPFVFALAAEHGKQNSRVADVLYRLASMTPQPRRQGGVGRQRGRLAPDGPPPGNRTPTSPPSPCQTSEKNRLRSVG